MAMALDIEVQAPANLSPPVIIGISAASVAFAALLLVLIFVLFRYKKVVRKVKELEPKKYPKNLPQPVNDLNVLEAIATNMGTVHSKDFMALDKLGMGEFGDVFKGACFTGGSAALCAIKSLKEDHRELLSDRFLEEAEIMRHLRHPNIVRIIGVSGTTEDDHAQICILMEFCPHGDLKNYLIKSPNISNMEKLWYGYQLALGCEYIAERHLVHRDIAARNCLLAEAGSNGLLVAKVSDFGLARAFEEHNPSYVMEGSGKLPLRWMSTEAIIDREFSQASDVWAYGITLWEIFSQGKTPYANRQTFSLAASIAGGVRCDRPLGIPTETYHLMAQCWMDKCEDRPTFKDIASAMKRMFGAEYASVGSSRRSLPPPPPIKTVITGPVLPDGKRKKKKSISALRMSSGYVDTIPAGITTLNGNGDIEDDMAGYTNPQDMLVAQGSDLERGLTLLGDYTSIRIKNNDPHHAKATPGEKPMRRSSSTSQKIGNRASQGSHKRKSKTILPMDQSHIDNFAATCEILSGENPEHPPGRPPKAAKGSD